jgi:hypothetical protein
VRKANLIGVLVVVLFLFPILNLSSDYSPATTLSNPDLPQIDDSGGGYTLSGDHSTGVAPALPVTLSGQVSNVGQGTLSFDSSSSGVASVALTDGWTGTDLQAQIDSITWTAKDVLQNGNLNKFHNEQFIVTSSSTVNQGSTSNYWPDGWTVFKNVPNGSPHPLKNPDNTDAVYRLVSSPSGYSSTYGVRMNANWGTSFSHTVNDEIYISQMVSLPWRAVYSATITFRYYVDSSSSMADQVHLFTRLAGYTTKFHVFESSDTKGAWLQATVTIQSGSMAGLSSHVAEFDIGLASDLSGTQSARSAQVIIDDIKVDFTVRPFPEQIDLKANGTLVWGSTMDSVYPYVPDDANRDCYDDSSSGIKLDGFSSDGVLDTGIYSSGFYTTGLFETGLEFPLDIPQGAIITSAYLEVEPASSSSPYLYGMRVHVADEDNVAAFTSGGHLETLFNWLDTTIDWSFNSWLTSPATRYRSPELGPLIQNVVSRAGWSEGNYICIMTSHMYSDYYQRWSGIKGTYGSFFNPDEAARLFVEYVIPEAEDHVLFFNHQKDITVNHLNVAGNLNDFPVLIDITDNDLRDNVLSGGNDIAFTINGASVDHEIELFEQSTGHLVAWVKVPYLSSSVDTVITMHYGCQNAPPALGSRVWSDYETVQHLNQDPTEVNYDSTSNNHDGTSYGEMGTSDLVAGQIGNAIDFDGSDDVISIGQINTDEWSQFTMSAWFYRTLDKDARVFSKSTTTTSNQHIMTLRLDPSNHVTTRLWADPQSSGVSYSSSATASNFTWHYVSWSWDPSRTGHEVLAYLDGNLIIDQSYTGTSIYDSDAMFVIGNNDLLNTRYWAGAIDEVRLTTFVRSEAWIDTEFNNQNDPSSFYAVGSPKTPPRTWTDASEPSIYFTTSSPTPVAMDVIVSMDVGGQAQTMDTDFDEGVSYFIESGSNIVNWTAKVMVSPPAGATSFGFTVQYPRAEWKATQVLNPMNQPKSLGSDWWYEGGTLTLYSSAIDFWGVWTLKFISWNFVQDIQMNKAVFNVDVGVSDSAQFTITTPTVLDARVGLELVDPTGTTWYSSYAQTVTDPAHRFPSFEHRKVITIPAAQVYGTVTNFPVLIQFVDSDLHDTNKVRADASDIMFASGNTILDHEIESFIQNYDSSNAFLAAWVKTNLTVGVDNYITMYYGSPIVDNLENPAGVWSNGFDAVWHLGESESTSSIHYDSTGNGYDGIRYGNTQTTGRIGFGQLFDNANDYISIDETLTPENDVLISGWFRLSSAHTSTTTDTKVIMEKYLDMTHNMGITLAGTNFGGSVSPGSLVFKVESSTEGAMYKWTSTITTWNANQWYFIACYADENAPANNAIWVNTAWATTAQYGTTTEANVSYVEEWRLGGGEYDSGVYGTGYFPGILDEFRVSNALRTTAWLINENRNQASPSSFLIPGGEQDRTSPEHMISTNIDSTYLAGEWTAVAYYNDTGTSVTDKTGLFETTFIVRHPALLTLNAPTDAIGDRLSVKTAGDALIVEYQLRDKITTSGVPGATVRMNWTSPSTITLDDYGGGRYGKVLDTDDLGDAKQWRIDVQSYQQYYNNATEYFNLDLYHATKLSASGVSATPADFNFTTTLTFKDQYTNAPITGATITYDDGSQVDFHDNSDGTYDIAIPTSALSLGSHEYTFNATKSGAYLNVAQVDVTFTLRAHYTSATVVGDLTTPYGSDTSVSVVLHDLDTGLEVDISDVNTLTFTYTGGYSADVFGSYSAVLTTADWNVGSVTATLTIAMSNSRIQAPAARIFTIQILAHKTSVTVTGVTTQPYGNQTALSIILTDLENGNTVPIGSVSNIRLQYSESPGFTDFGSYDITLDTSSWPVGTYTVTVIVTMSGTIYSAPSNYQFNIRIRSMTSVMYIGPSALNFTIGSDFTVNLHLNTSEIGPYYGDPITGRNAGEFSVPGYARSIDTSQQSNGVYKLTIDQSYFTGGTYQITVYFTSTSSLYGNTFLIIQFSYREIVSYLSSPNYPQVTTPYQLNVEISLEYADADFGTGIAGAIISSPDHPTWIANWTDETGGFYSVWIDVSSLAKGTHYISLTADKSGYDARTLQFRIVIRDAYTSITPSVGSLDIPIGNSPVFYVDYTDIDRLQSIENLTSPYTQVSSSWSNFSVEYLSGTKQYKITFHTSFSDTLSQNQVYTFTFSKSNYQTAQFSITVTIRTHNTDFRIVSSIEPTSTIGVFNISVYYGDLDSAVGIKSSQVIFSVWNLTGPVSSSYDYDSGLGDGFYMIHVPASQFGLGFQTFTVYADWTGAVEIYKDKSFVTSANVVGRDSSLTLLMGSEPTPYGEDMSYTFFYNDLGTGIGNLTGNVFIFVSFGGESVNPSDITYTDYSMTEIGKYSVEFNSGIFSRTGLIYMYVFVNWSKGVAPFYSNRTDTVSIRVLPRDTLLSITPAPSTSYNEFANFTLTYEDITGSFYITDDPKLSISLNVSFSYVENAGIFTITVNTSQLISLGVKAIQVDVTWSGSPFYANRTGRITYINVVARLTSLEYLTPPPTQYGDQATFNVTWTDTTEGASIPITSATVILKEGSTPIDPGDYTNVEISPGVYQVTLDTTYATSPGTVTLRVEISSTEFYYISKAINRQFTIQERRTIVAAEPVAAVPFGSTVSVIVSYLDLFTGTPIANDTAHGYPVVIVVAGQTYISTWRVAQQNYHLNISWNPSWDVTWTPGTVHSLTISMDYAYQAPYYMPNQVTITFTIRNRQSTLSLDTEPETTPYLDDVIFTMFYGDNDAAGAGISGADIFIAGLTETTDFLVSEGSAGYYTIAVHTTSLGSLGTHVLNIQAEWTGAPYHDAAARSVSVVVRTRATNLEVTVPPSQTLYFDDVVFEFEFNDLDAGTPITGLNPSIIHLYWSDMTEINQLDYSIIESSGTYELTISSVIVSPVTVSGISIRVVIDWPAAVAPFYADDYTIVKATITGRSILVETDQIQRTPKDDLLNITVHLSDLDNSNPIEGAIIQFSCQGHSLLEGVDYTKTEGAGAYTYNVDTQSLLGTGTFTFYITVQWNPNLQPFYSNRSTISLSGIVDPVRTSLRVFDVPSSVQYTGKVSLLVNWTDLDHGLPVSGFAGVIQSNIKYLISGLSPSALIVFEVASTGVYNISFSTSDLPALRSYTLVITAAGGKYASATVNPQFTVVAITTEAKAVEGVVTVYWKQDATILIDFRDLFNNVTISSADSVIWSLPTGDEGPMTETGLPGRYTADIGTLFLNATTYVVTVTADKNLYSKAITTITLVVSAIPSDIIILQPTEIVKPVNRGDSVDIEIELWDVNYGLTIDDTQVSIESGNLQVYALLSNVRYYMTYNVFTGTWSVSIPGSATILEALLSYDVRIFATFRNYEPAVDQFKIYIDQTATQLRVTGIPDPTKLEVYYLQNVTMTLNFTAKALGMLIDNGSVFWRDNTRTIYLNFTSIGNGLWTLTFNTSILGFGTVGVTFHGEAANTTLAPTLTSITLTVKKIPTDVTGPTETMELIWGWTGYIPLYFNDTHNERLVSGATVTYNYGNLDFNATDLGNGTYTIYIDTTILGSNVRERVFTSFILPNYEERSFSFFIKVLERPTELLVEYPNKNFVSMDQEIIYLQLAMGDTIDISLFYNDSDTVGGLFGGITDANFTEYTELRAPGYFGSGSMPIVFQTGSGYYNFSFDTNDPALYGLYSGRPVIVEGEYFRFRIEIFDENRQLQTLEIRIRIRYTPVVIEHNGQIVNPDDKIVYTLINGQDIVFDFYLNDTWHVLGVNGASFYITSGSTARISSNSSLGNGYYRIVIKAVGYGGDSLIDITMKRAFHDDVQMSFVIHTEMNDLDRLVWNATRYGLPIMFIISALLVAYVKVWSVPKRIRQINGQVKALRKGKIPKPIKDVKSRQQLAAELFNDTFESLKITRTAAQMPEDAIPIEVPEMGELLMQLAILTNLSQIELDDFQSDIKKMKMSEQAAFVKEVIMQEAIRAARRQGKTIEETLVAVEQEALRRLRGEEEETKVEEIEEVESEEPVFLEEEEVEVAPEKKVTPKKEEIEEEREETGEKMSLYEIEELRKDLERRGVPPHEIETIIEQAKELPRELVDELVKSLGGKKD